MHAASKLDLACMLEPEIHKLLKALSSSGIRGKVTMSERGKKEATVLASLDFCSLVPVAGEGLNNIANKQMLLDAAIPCPQSQRRRSHAQTQASSNSLGMGLVSMSASLLLQSTRLCWLTTRTICFPCVHMKVTDNALNIKKTFKFFDDEGTNRKRK